MSRLADRLKRLEVAHSGAMDHLDQLQTEEQITAWAQSLGLEELDQVIAELERRLSVYEGEVKPK